MSAKKKTSYDYNEYLKLIHDIESELMYDDVFDHEMLSDIEYKVMQYQNITEKQADIIKNIAKDWCGICLSQYKL